MPAGFLALLVLAALAVDQARILGVRRELLDLSASIAADAVAASLDPDAYHRGGDLPTTARAAGVQKIYMNDRGFAVLAAVEKVAAGVGATPAQVALSWLAHRPGITAPIASATSVTQLKEIVGAIDLKLDAEATTTLDQASAWRE